MHRVIAEMLTNQAQHLGQQFVWLEQYRQMGTDILDGLELQGPFARFIEGARLGDGHRRLVGNLRQPAQIVGAKGVYAQTLDRNTANHEVATNQRHINPRAGRVATLVARPRRQAIHFGHEIGNQ